MPNLDEFMHKPEKVYSSELERIGGAKPCSKCDKDSIEYFWDPISTTMTWECVDGHKNSFVIE
jgi:hypothetical protein